MKNKLSNPIFIIVASLTIIMIIIVFASAFLWVDKKANLFPETNISDETVDYGLIASAKGHFESTGGVFPDRITFQVDQIEIDKEKMKKYYSNAESACIGYLGDTIRSSISQWVKASGLRLNSPVCIGAKKYIEDNSKILYIFNEPGEENNNPSFESVTNFYMNSDAYYMYPFDFINMEVQLSPIVFYYDSQDSLIEGRVTPSTLRIDNEGRKLNGYNLKMTSTKNGEEVMYLVEFSRSPILQYFTGLLLVFLLLVPSFVTLVDNASDAIEITIAFFLGAWSFRQIIVPSAEISRSFIDLIFLGEYSLVIISLLLTLYAISRNSKKEKGEVDNYLSLPTSKVFHSSRCSIVSRYPASRLDQYKDIAHAKQAGKRPCRYCL